MEAFAAFVLLQPRKGRVGNGPLQPLAVGSAVEAQKRSDLAQPAGGVRKQVFVTHRQHGKRRARPALDVARPIEQPLAKLMVSGAS